ncbi:MAG: hypothetical protein ABI867_01335 [Kofleriaceae bacterium]
MSSLKRVSAAGHFQLEIDGHASTAYIKSVEGGFAKATPVEEPIGPDNQRIKHSNVVDVDPFSIECGFAGSAGVLRWIQASWQRKYNRRNGQISHAGFDLKKTYEHEFYDALITEASFPALETTGKDPAFLKLKIQPETVRHKAGTGSVMSSTTTTKQKLWTPNAFRFTIDQFSNQDDLKTVSKIESFTIKQGIKKFYTGKERFPQIEPTKIEFPHLVCTIPFVHATEVLKYHEKYVMTGQDDRKAQVSGSIEFLTPDRTKTLFAINFFEAGLFSASMVPAPANADQIKRVKFELYVGRMDIDGSGDLGLE